MCKRASVSSSVLRLAWEAVAIAGDNTTLPFPSDEYIDSQLDLKLGELFLHEK